jgi:flagellar motility protein MotE (MotC chaperone)
MRNRSFKQQGFIGEIIKPLMSWVFKSASRIKWLLIILSVAAAAGGAWWLNSQYEKALAQAEVLKSEKASAVEANRVLGENIAHLNGKIDEIQKSYEEAIERRAELEKELRDLDAEYQEAVAVFEKEKGRFNRLFERKAGLIILKANKATEKVFNDLEAAANEKAVNDNQ